MHVLDVAAAWRRPRSACLRTLRTQPRPSSVQYTRYGKYRADRLRLARHAKSTYLDGEVENVPFVLLACSQSSWPWRGARDTTTGASSMMVHHLLQITLQVTRLARDGAQSCMVSNLCTTCFMLYSLRRPQRGQLEEVSRVVQARLVRSQEFNVARE